MKKSFHSLWGMAALGLVIACQPSPRHQPAETIGNEEQQEAIDSTRYGVCGEGTSMHSLELITNDGDTLVYNYNTEEEQVVRGGLMVGDRIAVIADTDEYGEQRATLIINLTSLLGRWQSIDKNFEVLEGGTISSHVQAETNPWSSWKVLNGQLLFDRDTFDIVELGADSLYLENNYGIYVYKRQQE